MESPSAESVGLPMLSEKVVEATLWELCIMEETPPCRASLEWLLFRLPSLGGREDAVAACLVSIEGRGGRFGVNSCDNSICCCCDEPPPLTTVSR